MSESDGKVPILRATNGGSTTNEYPWKAQAAYTSARPWNYSINKYLGGRKAAFKRRKAEYSFLDWAAYLIPCVSWLRTYKIKEYLVGDILAGLSVGFMIVVQGISYANLAGVPAVYGLYGAFLPSIAYAVVGTSKQLAVGPVAVTSTIIGNTMHTILSCSQDISNPNVLTTPDQVACQAQYNHMVIQVAFIVACLYTSIGALRLGWVTNFLSHAVISGFMTGAAITIGMSQVKYILGYAIVAKETNIQTYMSQYIVNARNFKWQEFIMGSTLLILLIVMKEIGKRSSTLPFKLVRCLGPLTACVIGLLAVIIGKVDTMGIAVVGNIPQGLPPSTVSWWVPIDNFTQLLPLAIIVTVVDLLESTSIARALARKNNYKLNYNLEIIGLGLANFVGAGSSAYTTTGSFSRSAVNDIAGAQSPLAQFVTAWVVGFVLLFLTNLFSHTPMNVLGAVIVASIVSLCDYEYAIYLFKVSKLDFLVWCASFLGTLFISVEVGIGIAVGLAVLVAIYQTAFPHTAVLGNVPGTHMYRNIKQYPDAQVTPGILAFRIDAQIYFANVKTIQDRMEKLLVKMDAVAQEQGLPKTLYVILDFTPVNHIDAMGLHLIEEWVFEFSKTGRQILLANPSMKVLAEMEVVRLADLIGREWVFISTADATACCVAQLTERGLFKATVCCNHNRTLAATLSHHHPELGPSERADGSSEDGTTPEASMLAVKDKSLDYGGPSA